MFTNKSFSQRTLFTLLTTNFHNLKFIHNIIMPESHVTYFFLLQKIKSSITTSARHYYYPDKTVRFWSCFFFDSSLKIKKDISFIIKNHYNSTRATKMFHLLLYSICGRKYYADVLIYFFQLLTNNFRC